MDTHQSKCVAGVGFKIGIEPDDVHSSRQHDNRVARRRAEAKDNALGSTSRLAATNVVGIKGVACVTLTDVYRCLIYCDPGK